MEMNLKLLCIVFGISALAVFLFILFLFSLIQCFKNMCKKSNGDYS